jgi:EAL domain-containing protein (putative c-di-GMP-specific phosphodiesterase class I)
MRGSRVLVMPAPQDAPPLVASLDAQVDAETHRVLRLACRHLQMDVGFIVEFVNEREVYRVLSGAAAEFGLQEGESLPGDAAYCMKMVRGELPNVIPDTMADPRVSALPITRSRRIGSYIAVPVTLEDGSVFGSFGCLNHEPRELDERDVRLIRLLGETVGEAVQAIRDREQESRKIGQLIADADLNIVLQPIFDIRDGHCLGVEALSRFPDAFGSPAHVFGAAHRAGLGFALEQLALQRAVTVVPTLASDQFLSLNLTPSVAYELAATTTEDTDVDLSAFVLEITEHAVVESYAKLRRRLRRWREQGLRLAIDDAGAGYASLSHVVELEPDMIKIDRSLIDGSANDRARRSAISAFVALAADLEAIVIAEGVELAADLAAVRELGIDAAQGYLLGRPTADHSQVTRWAAGSDVYARPA